METKYIIFKGYWLINQIIVKRNKKYVEGYIKEIQDAYKQEDIGMKT